MDIDLLRCFSVIVFYLNVSLQLLNINLDFHLPRLPILPRFDLLHMELILHAVFYKPVDEETNLHDLFDMSQLKIIGQDHRLGQLRPQLEAQELAGLWNDRLQDITEVDRLPF